jgi:hypothetical protein
MSQDIISKKTRYEFREYLVNWTLREIEMEFDAADVPFDEDYEPRGSGQRRSRVEKYYHSIDWTKWSDVRKVLTVYENILTMLEEHSESEYQFINSERAKERFKSLKKWIEKDGFQYVEGKLIPIGKNQALQQMADTAAGFDAPELHRQIERMQNAVEDDPDLAIGTAKELVETTCKTILEERGVQFDEHEDITKLVKETRKALGLVPDNIPDSAKGAEIIRRLLSNLGSIAQGLGELRNLYGTGHGKVGKSKGLSARHARLAVGIASTLVTFLFETHKERNI